MSNFNTNYDFDETIDYSTIYNQSISYFDESKEFNNYINNYNIEYDYLNYYNIDTLLEKNSNTIDIKYTSSNNPIDNYNELYEIVSENNDEFMKNSTNKNFYKEFRNGKLKDICKNVMNVINKYINNENKNEVYKILNNLKILSRNITSSGYVDDKNSVLVISENKSLNGETFENIVSHEAVHLLQLNSAENITDGNRRIGVCINWEDEKINSLDWSWFYEASAALCMENTLNTTSGSYKNDINYLNSIKIATFLNSPTATSLEEICNNKDINKLFDYFGCQNEAEKKEVVAMMYSIEIINNKPKEFMELISNDTSSIEKMKRDVYLTMSKYFYRNLSQNINNMNINEIFSLINLFEANINNTIVTNYYKKFDINKDFMKDYTEIQNMFFSELSDSTNIDYNILYNSFLNYSINKSKNTTITISFLNEEKNSWLNKQKELYLSQASYSIQEDYQIFSTNSKTK